MNELKYHKIPQYRGAGVYAIFNIIDMMVYVGETTNINKRAKQHLHLLRLGKHPILKLQNDVSKNLRFVVLKKIPDHEVNNIRITEKVFILKMYEYGFRLYNKPCKFIDISGAVSIRKIEESIALNVIYNYREDGIDEIKEEYGYQIWHMRRMKIEKRIKVSEMQK